MRIISAAILSALLFSSIIAQDPVLPRVLQPDEGSISAAASTGVEVFKLLPRGSFRSDSHKDGDNPIGIREGGAFYSFTKRHHSYNRTPQIIYEGGNLRAGGFYGANYGFLKDLGPGSLADVSREGRIPEFLLSYRPPILESEIRKEQRKSHDYVAGDGRLKAAVAPTVGHVYALRSISFKEADVLVAFQIQQIGADGSLTIGWKMIREFDVPKLLYQTEEQLRSKIEQIAADPRYQGVTFTVKDDQLTLSGSIDASLVNPLLAEIREKAGAQTVVRVAFTRR